MNQYFNRDLSWLSFNERVLDEADNDQVPLMERIRFLGIYSSNLDEFYRVRMPALMALANLDVNKEYKPSAGLLHEINDRIYTKQKYFGAIIENKILQELGKHNVRVLYNEDIPEPISESLRDYFIHQVAAYLRIRPLSGKAKFFPENNKLYKLIVLNQGKKKRYFIVNIPSDILPRFYSTHIDGTQYIIFLDDIIKLNLATIFPDQTISGSYNFKTTRDAEIDLQDEFSGNLAKKIEKKLVSRDRGEPTRFLYEPGVSHAALKLLRDRLGLQHASFVKGGVYHNLKDLSQFPLKEARFSYEEWPRLLYSMPLNQSLFDRIQLGDILLHPPFHKYDTVLRFFNEAAIDGSVEKIYLTLYRIAQDSRIAEALISAAQNGKKVTVFVELKARFDEANNIRWSKRMKAAGIKIIESIPGLKVHAKVALVKRKKGSTTSSVGIISTGNFNESTARYYTDHLLLTADTKILKEAEDLFLFLKKGKKQASKKPIKFRQLLVGQFNLQQRFIELIEREIVHAEQYLPAFITIKLNNLEDRVLIDHLYRASQKGVHITLIVRSICCLIPGVPGLSENITVRRIIDRYLEHGRVFIFANNDNPEVFIGSADWMNRNIYRRIEVCVPIKDPVLKKELLEMINIQLKDNCKAVSLNQQCANTPVASASPQIRAQKSIGQYIGETK